MAQRSLPFLGHDGSRGTLPGYEFINEDGSSGQMVIVVFFRHDPHGDSRDDGRSPSSSEPSPVHATPFPNFKS